MKLDKKTNKQLLGMLYDLISQRSKGRMSPGEYRSRSSTILEEMSKREKNEKSKYSVNEAYDRAMRGI